MSRKPDPYAYHLRNSGLTVARDNGALVVQGARDAADLNRYLAERGHYVRELVTLSPGLESVFLRLTHDAELGSASRGEGPRSRRS